MHKRTLKGFPSGEITWNYDGTGHMMTPERTAYSDEDFDMRLKAWKARELTLCAYIISIQILFPKVKNELPCLNHIVCVSGLLL